MLLPDGLAPMPMSMPISMPMPGEEAKKRKPKRKRIRKQCRCTHPGCGALIRGSSNLLAHMRVRCLINVFWESLCLKGHESGAKHCMCVVILRFFSCAKRHKILLLRYMVCDEDSADRFKLSFPIIFRCRPAKPAQGCVFVICIAVFTAIVLLQESPQSMSLKSVYVITRSLSISLKYVLIFILLRLDPLCCE